LSVHSLDRARAQFGPVPVVIGDGQQLALHAFESLAFLNTRPDFRHQPLEKLAEVDELLFATGDAVARDVYVYVPATAISLTSRLPT